MCHFAGEATYLVEQMLPQLLEEAKLPPERIGIITPYKAQVKSAQRISA